MCIFYLSLRVHKYLRSLNSDEPVAGHGDARSWGPFAAVARVCDGARAVRLFGGIPAEMWGTYPCAEQNVRVAGQRRAVRKYKCSPSHNRIVPHPRKAPLLLLSSAGNVPEAFLRWALVIAGGGDVSTINTCYLGTPVSLLFPAFIYLTIVACAS